MKAMVRLLALLLTALPNAQTEAQESQPSVDVALSYLETLYSFDFERLGVLLAPDATFTDVTAAVLGGVPLHAAGRDSILASFEAGASDSRNAGFEIGSQFATGDHVILTLTYKTEIRGEAVGVPGAWVPVQVPAVTVLRVVDGLISEHIDYVDYEEMLNQISNFPRPLDPGD